MSEVFPCHYSSTALMCFMAAIQAVVYALCADRRWDQWKLGLNIRLLTVIYVVWLHLHWNFLYLSFACCILYNYACRETLIVSRKLVVRGTNYLVSLHYLFFRLKSTRYLSFACCILYDYVCSETWKTINKYVVKGKNNYLVSSHYLFCRFKFTRVKTFRI